MRAERPWPLRARRRGLSLIELMIGLVISLLVGLAAVNSARVFGAAQRQAMSAGAGLVSATGALGMVKNDIAAAGLGFFDGRLPVCSTMNLSVGNSLILNGAAFQPIQVTRSLEQDQLDLVYASDVSAGIAQPLSEASTGTSSQTLSTLPALVNQAVMLSPDSTGLCTVRTVTAITAATTDTPQVLSYGAAGQHNQVAFATAPNYAKGGRVTLLGTLVWHRYRLREGNLVLEQPLTGASSILVRNVVAMRVSYGVANAGSSTLAGWRSASEAGWGTLTPATVARVRAVRIGLLVRSAQREKPDADGQCRASSSKPVLLDETIQPDVSDWQCWRFRASSAIVPLRNLTWGQTP